MPLFLKLIGSKLVSALGGPLRWVATFVLEYLIHKIKDAVLAWIAKRKQNKADKKSEEKYEEVVKKGGEVTVEERKESTDEFLNRTNDGNGD